MIPFCRWQTLPFFCCCWKGWAVPLLWHCGTTLGPARLACTHTCACAHAHAHTHTRKHTMPVTPTPPKTHLSLCVMAACCSRPLMVVNSRSSLVSSRCSKPCCTLRLPEYSMTLRNASTWHTISSFGWYNRGTTCKQDVDPYSHLATPSGHDLHR